MFKLVPTLHACLLSGGSTYPSASFWQTDFTVLDVQRCTVRMVPEHFKGAYYEFVTTVTLEVLSTSKGSFAL